MKKISKKNRILMAIVALFTVVVLAVAMILFFFNDVKTIDFQNYSNEEIIAWVKDKKLEENVQLVYDYSDDVPKDMVISQSLPEGIKIKDQKLIIHISKGFDPNVEFEIPKDIAKSKYKLVKWFKENHFENVKYEYVKDDKVPLDKIISISVSGKVKRGTNIVVKISQGKQDVSTTKVKMIDLKKMSKNDIEKWAAKNKINVEFYYDYSDSIDKGYCIDQEFEKDQEILEGQSFFVTISDGKAIKLISFINKSKSEIDRYAKNNNINVSYRYDYSDSVSEGYVISQNPGVYTKVKEGSTVTATVSKGSDNITPNDFDYVNKPLSDLKNAIKRLNDKYDGGVSLREKNSYYSDSIASGNVISHDRTVKYNSIIGYVISLGKYNVSASHFNNKSVSDINNILNKANSLNAGVKLESKTGTFSSDGSTNSYNCSWSGKTLFCSFYKGKDVYAKMIKINDISICGGNESCEIELDNISNTGKIKINIEFESIGHAAGTINGQIESQSVKVNQNIKDGSKVIVRYYEGEPEPDPKLKFDYTNANAVTYQFAGQVQHNESYEKRLNIFNQAKNKVINSYKERGFTNVRVEMSHSTTVHVGSFDPDYSGNTPKGYYYSDDEIVIGVSIGKE